MRMFLDNGILVGRWPVTAGVKDNWGDKLNKELIHRLSGLPVAHINDVMAWADRPVLRVIGSGLGDIRREDVIWGMGFIDSHTIPDNQPAMVCAVRGPKSRARLNELGIQCPEIYGDPAILYPLTYWPDIVQDHDVGVIQHFREFGALPPPLGPKGTKIRYIDICSDVKAVVREILSCKTIVSSSLHGLICAHAYGIPAYWLKASDLPVGDDFKFFDYFESIGRTGAVQIHLDGEGRFDIEAHDGYLGDSRIRFAALLESCPFIPAPRKRDWGRIHQRMRSEGRRGVIFDQQN